jgi:hypothetical protein
VSQRRHAASDGSFAKSAGGAAGRGLLLIAIAVIVGVLLLRNGFDDNGGSASAPVTDGGSTETTVSTNTTAAGGGSTDSTAATTAPSVRPPNQVKVFVANGAGIQGAAGKAADTLKAAGYVAVAGNSPNRVQTTTVYYTEGFQAEAQAVAASLGAPAEAVQPMPTPPPVADIQGAQVLVVLGPDIAAPA